MKMLIIGGTGEMGQWFTRFCKEHGYEVMVWGSSRRVDVADNMGVEFASDLENAISDSDIVVVSVPIDITEKVIAETAPKMKDGSLLMDITSLKAKPVEAMKKYAPEGVEIIGTHPMFGPSIPGLHGQIVIMTPVKGRCDKWFPIIRALFEENGAHIEVIDAKEHDKFVSVVQGLTHFAYITIGTTFKRLDFDVNESRRFMSPVYEIMVDFVGRILGQNPYLYALIQMENPEVLKVHDAFKEECVSISNMVRQHDVDGFSKKMKDAAVHFGDTNLALHRSDNLINSKIHEFDELVNSIGTERGLEHIYSGVTHVGIIKKITPREVILSKNGKVISLKIENIRLLSDHELVEWKTAELVHSNRDISVLIPVGANPNVLLGVITNNKRIVSASVIDTYSGIDTERLSVTYRITIIGDREPAEVQDGIQKLLIGLGCELRGLNQKMPTQNAR
ncbi:MAG: prephenate dehydrogenase [Methanosarcinaceae archaeon]|nr:prephenate dehydrogenase [Methanosarcinaceae archaeon]MDF1532905.1 prephenate dehydrogenase [Methanosarcinaceae archaeon]